MGQVSILASCQNCKWTAETNNGMALAFKHSKKYGHRVNVQQVICCCWENGKRKY